MGGGGIGSLPGAQLGHLGLQIGVGHGQVGKLARQQVAIRLGLRACLCREGNTKQKTGKGEGW